MKSGHSVCMSDIKTDYVCLYEWKTAERFMTL